MSSFFGSRLHSCRLNPVEPFDNLINSSGNPGLMLPVLNIALLAKYTARKQKKRGSSQGPRSWHFTLSLYLKRRRGRTAQRFGAGR